jgi:hypothetical protein
MGDVLSFDGAKRCFKCGRGKDKGTFIMTITRLVDGETKQVHGACFKFGDTDRMYRLLGIVDESQSPGSGRSER